MHGEIDDWKNNWYGVRLGISPAEINGLIKSLEMIRDDPSQHFHISSDYKAAGGLGDIEVYLLPSGSHHNMSTSGGALAPGDAIPGPNPD